MDGHWDPELIWVFVLTYINIMLNSAMRHFIPNGKINYSSSGTLPCLKFDFYTMRP